MKDQLKKKKRGSIAILSLVMNLGAANPGLENKAEALEEFLVSPEEYLKKQQEEDLFLARQKEAEDDNQELFEQIDDREDREKAEGEVIHQVTPLLRQWLIKKAPLKPSDKKP